MTENLDTKHLHSLEALEYTKTLLNELVLAYNTMKEERDEYRRKWLEASRINKASIKLLEEKDEDNNRT